MQLICTWVGPVLNTNTINVFQVALLYSILQRKRISLGKWIHEYMRKCVFEGKFGIYFPHLVMDLCLKVGVKMEPT